MDGNYSDGSSLGLVEVHHHGDLVDQEEGNGVVGYVVDDDVVGLCLGIEHVEEGYPEDEA